MTVFSDSTGASGLSYEESPQKPEAAKEGLFSIIPR